MVVIKVKRLAKAALLILGALSVIAAIAAWMVYQDENISRDEDSWRLEHNQRFEQDFGRRKP